METLIRDLGLVAVPLVALHAMGAWRWRGPAALALAVAVVLAGFALDVLAPATAAEGWQPALTLQLCAWVGMGVAARRSDLGDRLGDSLLLASLLAGFAFGAVPAVLLLAPAAGARAHRVALAATAAALFSPVGSPMTLAIGPLEPQLAWLGLLLLLVARPSGVAARPALGGLLALGIVAVAAPMAAQIIGLVWLAVSGKGRWRWPRGTLAVLAAAVLLAWTARHAGLAHELPPATEWLLLEGGSLGGPVLAAAAGLLGVLGGALPASIVLGDAFGSPFVSVPSTTREALVIGFGLGSLVPLRLSGMLSEGRRLWLVSVVLGGLAWSL